MPLGTAPADIYHNNQWYSRSGQPIGGAPFSFGSNTPIGFAPSGTIAANGALTLGTALSRTYFGGCYLYLPAGAAFSGSAAGFYWCVMGSTTVGTVFNNQPGIIPQAPAIAVSIVDAGPGVYTGGGPAAGTLTVATFTIPGGSIGPNGLLLFNNEFAWTNSASAKVFNAVFGGSTVVTNNRTSTGLHDSFTTRIRNLGVESRSSFYGNSESSTLASTAEGALGINTAQDQLLTFTISSALATDCAMLQSFQGQVTYGA